MTLRTTCLAAAIVLSPAAGIAQMIQPCDDRVDVTTIVEPWEIRSRAFAEGAIRIFEVHVNPNVAYGAFIAVLHPDPSPDGIPQNRACTAILSEVTGANGGSGQVGEAFIEDAIASYDPARGLTISVPVSYLGGAYDVMDTFVFTVNQATGEVTPG